MTDRGHRGTDAAEMREQLIATAGQVPYVRLPLTARPPDEHAR